MFFLSLSCSDDSRLRPLSIITPTSPISVRYKRSHEDNQCPSPGPCSRKLPTGFSNRVCSRSSCSHNSRPRAMTASLPLRTLNFHIYHIVFFYGHALLSLSLRVITHSFLLFQTLGLTPVVNLQRQCRWDLPGSPLFLCLLCLQLSLTSPPHVLDSDPQSRLRQYPRYEIRSVAQVCHLRLVFSCASCSRSMLPFSRPKLRQSCTSSKCGRCCPPTTGAGALHHDTDP